MNCLCVGWLDAQESATKQVIKQSHEMDAGKHYTLWSLNQRLEPGPAPPINEMHSGKNQMAT